MIYHVLNGDALKERFPKSLNGQWIVFRECLCQGPITENLDEIFIEQRQSFLKKLTGERINYKVDFVSEIEPLIYSTENDIIYCWFEYDLFCQMNLWFLINYLNKIKSKAELRLVLPPQKNKYSFAACSDETLKKCLQESQLLGVNDKIQIEGLWKSCVNNSDWPLIDKSSQLYLICKDALKAYTKLKNDKHIETLLQHWINDLKMDDFGKIYQKFSKEEPSFGFGDLQLKYILDTNFSA